MIQDHFSDIIYYTHWRVVPTIANFIFVHHGIQSSLRQSVLLPAFEEYFHLYTTVMDHLLRYSGCHRLNHLRLTNIHSSIPIRRHRVCHTLGVFQRLPLLHHLALQTVTYDVQLPCPIVVRGGKPFNSASPPPHLAHRRSSTQLLHSILTPRFPTSHRIQTWGRRCTWMAFLACTFRG